MAVAAVMAVVMVGMAVVMVGMAVTMPSTIRSKCRSSRGCAGLAGYQSAGPRPC
jgi:uncharacterized membrane protein